MWKKCLAIVLMCILAWGPVAYAAPDTEGHWASSFIEVTVERGLLPLFDGERFEPSRQMSKGEALMGLSALGRTVGLPAGDDLGIEPLLVAASVPETIAPYTFSVPGAVTDLIGWGVLTTDEFSGFAQPIDKVSFAAYAGRLLNAVKQEDLGGIMAFSYHDAHEISYRSAPYVELLIRHDVIGEQGDAEGNFNPDRLMTRDLTAVFLEGLLGAMTGEVTIEVPVEEARETVEVQTGDRTYEGRISYFDPEEARLWIRDGAGHLTAYPLPEGVDPLQLVPGHQVWVEEDGFAIGDILFYASGDFVDGKLVRITDPVEDARGESYRVLELSVEGKKRFFALYNDVLYKKGETSVERATLVPESLVRIYYKGYEASSVVALVEEATYTGVLTREAGLAPGGAISLMLENGEYYERPLPESVEIEAEEGFTDGDIVTLTISRGAIHRVENTYRRRLESGELVSLTIAATPRLTIRSGTEEATYGFALDTVVDGGQGTSADLYALRLGDPVNLRFGTGGIERIAVGEVPSKALQVDGEIIHLLTDRHLLTIRTAEGVEELVAIPEDMDFSALAVGDRLVIEGIRLNDRLIEALRFEERIIGD